MSTANTRAANRPEAKAESIETPWDELATKIQEGEESGPAAAMTTADWNEVEAKIRAAAKTAAAR